MTSTDQAAALLGELVACPSVNATRAVGGWPPYGEQALARLVGERLSSWARRWSGGRSSPAGPT